MSQLPCFLLLFSILSSFSMNGQGSNSWGKTCPSHDCSGVSISYPFWQLDSTTSEEFCGYPGFGITCSSDTDFPIIKLSNHDYLIKNIDYENSMFTLVDVDVVGQKCPRVTHNLSLEHLPLLSTSEFNVNLTFYFNCTSDFPPTGVQIECLASVSNKSYVRKQERFDDTNWYEYCEDKVEAAVMDPPNGIDGFIKGFSSAFDEGFLLNWQRLGDCGECEASGGRCWYNNVTKVFLCFCSDGTIKNNKQYCPAA